MRIELADRPPKTVVIGAGVGGLAAAIRLAAAGHDVHVFERHDHVGGKMRTVPSDCGPIDAGPTVLTMRHVFDDLFEAAGRRLDDYVTLIQQETIARHWWSDGSQLDLFHDERRSRDAIQNFASAKDARAFEMFSKQARMLFDAFDGPMIRNAKPTQLSLTGLVLRQPKLIPALRPLQSLASSLTKTFKDPRLRQLFGRYSTYVGGSPFESPALLSMIWDSESRGVWKVEGGMHRLAQAMAALLRNLGAEITVGIGVERPEFQNGVLSGVVLDNGTRVQADNVVFNGDPRALRMGLMGQPVAEAIPAKAVEPRSLSARVWSFAGKASGRSLIHHNVFFADDERSEFGDLREGRMPSDATLYVCAQDRDDTGATPDHAERFEIIINAAPTTYEAPEQEFLQCQTQTFDRLAHMGLNFDLRPGKEALTTPNSFEAMFPGSAGSLYGRSPHGMTASLKRPTARTAIPGVYLVGGGAHPGAGIPMATLSAQHAVAAILQDQISTSTSPKTATRGGMSTGSAKMAAAPSRSSPL